MVAGIVILLLPILLTLWNDHRIDQVARGYDQQVKQLAPPTRVRGYLREAHAYNARLAASGHHAAPPVPGTPGLEDYLHTLDAPENEGVIGRITIPRIGVNLPIYHTTSEPVLKRGAGHMFGSDLPVGGAGTTSVVSAHTGMVDASMFDNLPRLVTGDEVFVDVMGQTLRYQVRGRQVVGPTDHRAVTYEPGVDKLVLVTCTPYGINTDRLLVETVRAPWSGSQVAPGWHLRLSWWMVLDLFLIALVLLLLVRDRRRRARREKAGRAPEGAGPRGDA